MDFPIGWAETHGVEMKRADIRQEVEKHLASLGFGRGNFVWQPVSAELMLVIGDTIRRIKLKSGMSRRALCFELGRITGWLEGAGLVREAREVRKPNGLVMTQDMFAFDAQPIPA